MTEPAAPKAVVSAPQPVAKIVKRVPRIDPLEGKSKGMAGTYRVIHGRLAVPREPAELLNQDGSRNEHALAFEYAIPGDHVTLGDDDAYRMLEADVIEALDAKPSRLNKVWAPPKVVPNQNGFTSPPDVARG
jgi:hypothetical protein